jgi:hypothetical protein
MAIDRLDLGEAGIGKAEKTVVDLELHLSHDGKLRVEQQAYTSLMAPEVVFSIESTSRSAVPLPPCHYFLN